jgi:Ca2+-binding RTX toxin-like protein
MAVLDNAIWLTGPGGTAENGATVIADGANATTVTGTFTDKAWDASQSGYAVSEFGAFGISAPITADYQFSNVVENLSFDLQHVNSSGATYDDMFTIRAYDADGNMLAAADVIAGLTGLVDETVIVNPDGSVTIEADGPIANNVTINLPGQISRLSVTFQDGPDGAQSGGAGIGDLSFSVAPPDDIVEGTGGDDLIDMNYSGDPEGDRIDAGDSTGAQTGNAGSDDDYVLAGGGDDTVDAGLGDDEVYGEGGDDSLLGDVGDDTLVGGIGADTLRGGIGDDSLEGGTGDDDLYGDEDNDTIRGGGGDDTIDGGLGADSLEGGDGADSISGNDGDDTIKGGAGDDWLRGSVGNDEMWGGEGDDYIWSGYNDDTIRIENNFGNDTISAEGIGEVTGDVLDLSLVTDDLTIDLTGSDPEAGTFSDGVSTATFEEIENIVLGGGRDTIRLADLSGVDRVLGFDMTDSGDGTTTDQLDVALVTSDYGTTPVHAGDVAVSDDGSGNAVLTFPGGESITLIGVSPSELDTIDKLVSIGIPDARDFVVEGGAGDDIIDAGYTGDPEGDRIDAGDHSDGSDDDFVLAGAGDDAITSGAGNDTVYGQDGGDTILGGAGNDLLDGDDGFATGGADSISGDDGADTILGDAFDDTLDGGAGDDDIYGGADDDLIDGGSGDDAIYGEGGDDTITLQDGFGNDTILGGENDETDGDTLDLSALNVDTTVDLTAADPEKIIVSDGVGSTVADEIEALILGAGRDTLILGDGGGSDTVNAFDMTDAGDGTTNDQLDVTGLTSDGGTTPVTAADVVVTDTNGDGTGDAILTFPNGESITLVGVTLDQVDSIAELEAIGIPCFTPGTLITTAIGQVAVEDIAAGDLVQTVDHGLQPVIWARHQHVSREDLARDPGLRPVIIRKLAFGNQRRMRVSLQHGLVWAAAEGRLIRAKHAAEYLGNDAARVDLQCRDVTYIHLMFDRHQLIYAEGAPAEAFYPGPMALKSLDVDTICDLISVMPAMARLIFEGACPETVYGPPARAYLKASDIRALLQYAA